MENKLFLILSVVLLIPIIAGGVFLLKSNSLKPSPSNLEECKTLSFNNKDSINLVFFSNKEDTKKYSDFLLSLSPFEQYKKDFNIYYIDDYQPECESYKGIAILCRSKEMIKKSSSCPNDFVFVLKSESSSIRSSAYSNILSINTQHPLTVIQHEFGHTFADFAEEYTPADLPSTSKNCVSSCDKFSVSDGCFQGCSKENYYRSIENGVMRTLSSNQFGKFNEQLIIGLLNKKTPTITGSAIEESIECENQEYYLIEVQVDPETNELKEISKNLEQGCAGTLGNGDSVVSLLDENKNLISSQQFNPSLIYTDSPGEEEIEGQTFKNQDTFSIKIPKTGAESVKITIGSSSLDISLRDIGARPCKV